MDDRALMERRERLLGENVPLFYSDPVHVVRGEGVWLWDARGRRYLDCYNNVPHVGHCHPAVVAALTRQAGMLNTHTRYLHDGILDYVERLTATFQPGLDAAILTCTGSEANDIALRMAQVATGRRGIIAMTHTYHGNTAAVSQLTSQAEPVGGRAPHIRFVPAPDSYRPLGGTAGAPFAAAFAAAVEAAIADLAGTGHGFAGLILDPFFGNEGFPDLPAGFLDGAVRAVRAAGGLVIADEVQAGFGRSGRMWAHERIGIRPDIVTLGKPMGNGHPVAGVVAGRDLLNAFRRRFRYFNTFGGNPVSAAVAMAVLDVIRDEGLVENAARVGAHARAGVEALARRHPVIGDVRGAGLFFGCELVSDRGRKTPAPDLAARVVDGMRAEGVLIGKLGIHGNVTKMRPPMPFTLEQADLLLQTLDHVLARL